MRVLAHADSCSPVAGDFQPLPSRDAPPARGLLNARPSARFGLGRSHGYRAASRGTICLSLYFARGYSRRDARRRTGMAVAKGSRSDPGARVSAASADSGMKPGGNCARSASLDREHEAGRSPRVVTAAETSSHRSECTGEGPRDVAALRQRLEGLEREPIVEALAKTQGNRAQAAQTLGVTERVMGLRV